MRRCWKQKDTRGKYWKLQDRRKRSVYVWLKIWRLLVDVLKGMVEAKEEETLSIAGWYKN